MDLIEDIGPILGIVAFLGFAILALLIVLQAREVRRLREWAGRAPERALEADDADRAAAEARGETGVAEKEPGRIAALLERVTHGFQEGWAEFDRRSPVEPRWILAGLLAAMIAAGVITSGFGLVGGDDGAPADGASRDGGRAGGQGDGDGAPTVTVLNATQIEDLDPPVPAVPGIADVVADQIVEPAGFDVRERTNAPAGEKDSVIMFEPDFDAEATELASAVASELGTTDVVPITAEISAVSKGADLVLLVGKDDDQVGQGTTEAVTP